MKLWFYVICSYLCHEFEMKGGRRSDLMGERIR